MASLGRNLFIVALLSLCSSPLWAARTATVDAITFNPATDGGRYISVYDAETMPQYQFNLGVYFHYEFEPIELVTTPTNTRIPVIDDIVMTNVMGAFGIMDWWSVGVNVPVIFYETYYNPNVVAPPGPKLTPAGLGDVRLETKFRLLDIEKYHVGMALIPYIAFPTGRTGYNISNEQFTPGGKIAIEGNISDRVWLSLNAGYQVYKYAVYFGGADGFIDDTINGSFGAHVKLNRSWSLIGEIYGESVRKNFMKNQRQSPVEAVGAIRYMPLNVSPAIQGLTFTAGGGGGLTRGVGASAFKGFVGINYRKPKIVELPPPPIEEAAEVLLEERIIITQKIHFEFDKATIRTISYPILDDVVTLLKQNPQIRRVEVAGHTDAIGSDIYNQRLSEMRSASVVNYLVEHGIERSRLIPIGYGEVRPVATNETTEGRANNRRTEFLVLD